MSDERNPSLSAPDLQENAIRYAKGLEEIRVVLGPDGLKDDPEAMEPYLKSWRNGWTGNAPFIAFPKTAEAVSTVMKICHASGIAVVPQGGNSGLVGGAIPSNTGDQIVLNLSRMSRIREVDVTGSAVTVEAGVILETLQEAVSAEGFFFPLSMASEGSAQIGGAISTNAGGTAVLRYGNMRELVLGLEVVLPNGTVLQNLKSLRKDNAGYNLNQIFIGSEGTLGIITAATLKLFPKLNQTVTGFIAFDRTESAMTLLARFRAQGGEHLNAFELMSRGTLDLVVKHITGSRLPFGKPSPFYLLIELGSASKDLPLRDLFETVASQALEEGLIQDVVLAESQAQAAKLWSLRENAAEALRQEGPSLHFDISLPLLELPRFLEDTTARIIALHADVMLVPFGHIGDGNIHYNMRLPPQITDTERQSLKSVIQKLVYSQVARLGGSISAEHGIGIERKPELLAYKAKESLMAMRALKDAFDPKGLLNPGKVLDVVAPHDGMTASLAGGGSLS